MTRFKSPYSVKPRKILVVEVDQWKGSPFEVGFVADLQDKGVDLDVSAKINEDGKTDLTIASREGRPFQFTFDGGFKVYIARSGRPLEYLWTEPCNNEVGLISPNMFAEIVKLSTCKQISPHQFTALRGS